MIKITNLEKFYRTEEVETIALNKLSIEVKKGEFVAIMGPSGCGKSTLLNILGMLDDPDEGSYVFNGVEVAHFTERKRADLRKPARKEPGPGTPEYFRDGDGRFAGLRLQRQQARGHGFSLRGQG